MDKATLIASAAQIPVPSEKAGAALADFAEDCAHTLTEQFNHRDDFSQLVGQNNEALAVLNHKNHYSYVASIATLYDPTSFVETVIWVLRTYRSKGFSKHYWDVMLPAAITSMEKHLSPQNVTELSAIHHWLIENFQDLLAISEATPSFFESLSDLGNIEP